MSRTERLLSLLQLLRSYRHPVTAAILAEKMNISVRSVYRDIAQLQQQGAHIEGEAGVGYILRPGYLLPPLMFSQDELEALVLGMNWVSRRGDAALSSAASHALAKVREVLPDSHRSAIDFQFMMAGPSAQPLPGEHLTTLREAIRLRKKVQMTYRDRHDQLTERTVWPFALGYFDTACVVAAWCELRSDIRHFTTHTIQRLTTLEETYPRQRHSLLLEWKRREGIP